MSSGGEIVEAFLEVPFFDDFLFYCLVNIEISVSVILGVYSL